nr:hypothetical protein [uncultured Mucilaginibacter sp.]
MESTEKVKVEANRYFYHSDHLGSTAFTTNAGGDVQQHLEYTPFGETYFKSMTPVITVPLPV